MNMKKTFKNIFAVWLLFSFCLPALSFAEETPENLRSQAEISVKTAFELMQEAQGIARGNITQEKASVLISLYTRAGQLFEKAATIYAALEPYQYASKQDVKNCQEAMQNCIRSIKDVRQRFQ